MAKIMLNGVDYSAPVASGVSGVKGNAESTYRTGNVNLTPENIGAAKSSIYGDTVVSMQRDSNSSVGQNSFVFCYNTGRASGKGSVALGGFAQNAVGDYAVSIGGDNNYADGYKSANIGGNYNHATAENSVTLGGIYNYAGNYASAICGKYSKNMRTGGDVFNQIGDVFVIGNGTGPSDKNHSNALRVTYLGDVLGTKAFQSSGADYAEFVKPWWDGNIYDEDRVGYFVTAKDGLLYKADEGDYIIGITSGNPSVVGNADEDYYWRYERDEFNRIVMEDVPEMIQQTDEEGNPVFDEETNEPVMVETGNMVKNARMKLAEDYDPSMQDSYVPRADRPEWDYVGMVGVLPVRDDGTCVPGQFCKCGGDGIATLATERWFDTYMVLERIAGNVVSVILK